jgi:adenosine deaminase
MMVRGVIVDDLHETIKALPKIELHRHLEGAIRLETLAEIAVECKLDLPGHDLELLRPMVQVAPDDPRNSEVFLAKFQVLRKFFRSREIIQRVAYEAVADAAADNVIYMELRFTPLALAKRKGYALADATDWVIDATRRAQKEFDIQVRLILSMNRNESVEIGQQVIDIAIDRMDKDVVGVDLAGDEVNFSARPFGNVFLQAKEAGLGITIHAGEWAGPENVRDAIERTAADRIGHGVRIIQDSGVIRLALEHNTVFEVCPTSNVQTGVAREYEQHPLRDLYQLGLRTTINTDDPSISGITLGNEMVVAVEHLGLSLDDVKRHIIVSAESAFLPAAEREKLVANFTRLLYPESEPAKLD